MGIVVVPTYGSDPATITAANLDAKVAGLATEFNGQIDNDNIKSAAGIVASKLDLSGVAQSVAMNAKDISEAKGADVASAGTTTIWVTDGNFIHITGTTTITSFGTAQQAGDERTIVFDGALTLTHNATSLILPTGANITTAAGDTAIVRAETTANARVIAYLRKSGAAITSQVLQTNTVVALSDGATPALDASLGNTFTLSAAGDRTIAIPTNAVDGQKIVIRHYASGGARTLALNTGAGGFGFTTDITALTQTVSGKYDYIGCIYCSTTSLWHVVSYTKGGS